jgi:hypothetical protein
LEKRSHKNKIKGTPLKLILPWQNNKWFSRQVFENQPLRIISDYHKNEPRKLIIKGIILMLKL